MKKKLFLLVFMLVTFVGCGSMEQPEVATTNVSLPQVTAEIELVVESGMVVIDMHQALTEEAAEKFVLSNQSDSIVTVQVIERAGYGINRHGEETIEVFVLKGQETVVREYRASSVGFYVFLTQATANTSGSLVGFARFD